MRLMYNLAAWVGVGALVYGCYLAVPWLAWVVGGIVLVALSAFGASQIEKRKDAQR